MKKVFGILLAISCLLATQALAETIADFLIIKEIGPYKLEKPFITARGQVVGGGEPKTSRYGNEAEGYYTSYSVGYDGGDGFAGPDVEIRVYESTQWMLHELEREHKSYPEKFVAGKTDLAATTKKIGNNVVTIIRIGGRAYFWISGNKMISIEYSDSQFQYPEPLEVINEYLSKYPSTLPETYQTRKRDKEWIKEEFDRLLWVSDRWVSLLQEGDPKRAEKLKEAADNLGKFARYRKGYFKALIGDKMDEDINLLQTSHMRPGQEEFIRAKLAEYKEWWASHKSEAINLP